MFYKIYLILLLIFSNLSFARAQEHLFDDPQTENQQLSSESQASSKVSDQSSNKPNVSFASFRDDFRRFCFFLAGDGQQDLWNAAIEKAKLSNDQCKPCRSLYKGLTCKSKADQKIKQVLSPSTELLAVTGEIFRTIAEDSASKESAVIAINPVLEDLNTIKIITTKEYFETLTAYIKAPLAEAFVKNQDKIRSNKKAVQKKQLDSLF